MTDQAYWLEHLAASGLDAKDAKKLGLRWLTPKAARNKLRMEFPLPHGGVYFPYFSLAGKLDTTTCRVRLLADPSNGYTEDDKLPKYLQPPGTPPRIYLPPYMKWDEIAKDPEQAIIITEGEKKAAAVCKVGLPCIGLGGVWSFQQKDASVPLLADLLAFNWIGRKVTLAYDSDWTENKDIRKAAGVFARRLSERGAEVRAALLGGAPGGGKVGVDDLLVARGVKALHAVLDAAFSLTPELEATAEYRARFVLIKTMGCAWDREDGSIYARKRFEDGFPDDTVQTMSPTGAPRNITKAQHWWQDPNKVSAKKLVLEPDQPVITARGDLNRFRGWGIDASRGSTEVWQKLLKLLFQQRTDLMSWFEQWCAYPIQHPGTKLHTAVFIYGGQGIGKTAVGRIMLDIYGKSGRMLQDREVFGGFNGWLGDTLFALGDDLAFDERRKSRSVIKMLVDSETVEVNEKYVPSYPVDNRCNFYFTANSPGALPLDPSGINRRFLVVEAPSERKAPREWYTKTLHNWRANGGSGHVHDRLSKLSLKGFYPYADAPESEAKHIVVETGRSGVEAWCSEIPLHTTLVLGTARELYDLYRAKTNDYRTGIGMFTASLRAVAELLPPQKIGENTLKLWAVRDIPKWRKAKPKAIMEQYNTDRGLV